MIDDVKPVETSWPKLVFAGFLQRFWSITAVAAAIIVVALWYGSLPVVPRWSKVFTLAAILALPLGVLGGLKIVSWFPDPDTVWIIDADAKEVDGALFEIPEPAFREFDVLEHELEQWAPRLYCGKGVRLDDEVIEQGTWRGSADDRELIAHLTQVYLIRDELEPNARRWQRLRPQLPFLVRARGLDEAAHAIESVEDLLLPSSSDETVFESVESHLDDNLIDEEEQRSDEFPDLTGADLDELDQLRKELEATDDLDLSIEDVDQAGGVADD